MNFFSFTFSFVERFNCYDGRTDGRTRSVEVSELTVITDGRKEYLFLRANKVLRGAKGELIVITDERTEKVVCRGLLAPLRNAPHLLGCTQGGKGGANMEKNSYLA